MSDYHFHYFTPFLKITALLEVTPYPAAAMFINKVERWGATCSLSKKKSSSSFTSVLNFLITEKKLLRYLDNYLLGFVFSEVQKTNYKLVPLKRYPSPHHTKIMFAQLIEYLPIIRSEIETDFVKNQDLINKLILEYLSKNADIASCKAYIHDESDDFEPDNYEPDTEKESEDLYEEYMKQQKEEQLFEDNLFQLHDVIMDFFSYMANKNKEGAPNGDNSKA